MRDFSEGFTNSVDYSLEFLELFKVVQGGSTYYSCFSEANGAIGGFINPMIVVSTKETRVRVKAILIKIATSEELQRGDYSFYDRFYDHRHPLKRAN